MLRRVWRWIWVPTTTPANPAPKKDTMTAAASAARRLPAPGVADGSSVRPRGQIRLRGRVVPAGYGGRQRDSLSCLLGERAAPWSSAAVRMPVAMFAAVLAATPRLPMSSHQCVFGRPIRHRSENRRRGHVRDIRPRREFVGNCARHIGAPRSLRQLSRPGPQCRSAPRRTFWFSTCVRLPTVSTVTFICAKPVGKSPLRPHPPCRVQSPLPSADRGAFGSQWAGRRSPAVGRLNGAMWRLTCPVRSMRCMR